MIKLRSRAPYTCRFETAGKPCAAYLDEDDDKHCKPHVAAIVRFWSQPFRAEPPRPSEDQAPPRRIWPGAESEAAGL